LVTEPGDAKSARICLGVRCDTVAFLPVSPFQDGSQEVHLAFTRGELDADSVDVRVDLLRGTGEVAASAKDVGAKRSKKRCSCGGISYRLSNGTLKRFD
jgi:hypothetical protein